MITTEKHPDDAEIPNSTTLRELTEREWDALLELTDDLLNPDLANRLHVNCKSLQNYKNRIGDKLALKSRDVLNRFARHHALNIKQWYEFLTGRLPPPRT